MKANDQLRRKDGKVKAWSNTPILCLFLVAIGLSGLVACDPFEKDRAEYAESQRIQCLDKFCPGDMEPTHDLMREVAFKLNGQWYIGTKEYGNPNFGPIVFYWPSKTAGYVGGDYPEKGQGIPKAGIEIFLSTKTDAPIASSMYQLLMQQQAKGHVIAKKKLRDGLEAWETRDGGSEEIWYVATGMKEQPSGDPPVVACRKPDYGCTMGFRWRPDISMDMRFNTKHGPDWPEIYQETIRVLQLLKKV